MRKENQAREAQRVEELARKRTQREEDKLKELLAPEHTELREPDPDEIENRLAMDYRPEPDDLLVEEEEQVEEEFLRPPR